MSLLFKENNNKYEYWELHFDFLFKLALNDNDLIQSEWFHFIDYRAMMLYQLFKHLLSNKGKKISIDELGFIPFNADDCFVVQMLFNAMCKDLDYYMILTNRELMLKEIS